MRFLADESCDFALVRALRASGCDVKAVAEVLPGATDDAVIELAKDDARILLTEDKDFGQLVFAAAAETSGVILIRYPATTRAMLGQVVTDLVQAQKDQLIGAFVVVQPGRVRITRKS